MFTLSRSEGDNRINLEAFEDREDAIESGDDASYADPRNEYFVTDSEGNDVWRSWKDNQDCIVSDCYGNGTKDITIHGQEGSGDPLSFYSREEMQAFVDCLLKTMNEVWPV